MSQRDISCENVGECPLRKPLMECFLALPASDRLTARTMMNTTNTEPSISDRMLRRVEAAQYVRDTHNIPCSPKTLAKLACVSSEGPPFRLAGRFPLYPVSGTQRLGARENWSVGPIDLRSPTGRLIQKKSPVHRPREGVRSRALERSSYAQTYISPPYYLQ